MTSRRTFRLFLLLPLAAVPVLVGGTRPADAWSAPVYRNMVYDTLRMLPPALARVLARREDELVRGVQALEGEVASRLVRDGLEGRVSADTRRVVEERVREVARMVSEHRSFDEIAFELGKLLRVAADLADPLVIGAGEERLAGAAAEYRRFVDLHIEEIPLVHDRSLPSPVEGGSLGALLDEIAGATRAAVPRLAEAFWRDGHLVPATAFDYRSLPFAEASLAYSRGVTGGSYLWLAAWSEANGDFTGYRLFRDPSSKKEQGKP